MKETMPIKDIDDDIDPKMIDEISNKLKEDQKAIRQEEELEDKKLGSVAGGLGEVYEFEPGMGDLAPEESQATRIREELEQIPEGENVEETTDDIPESGLRSIDDPELKKYIQNATKADLEELKLNRDTREEAIRDYEERLANEAPGSDRAKKILEYMKREEAAYDAFDARIKQLSPSIFKRFGGWFKRK